MKTVLITGSSRGIGRETAIYFAQQGWNVIIHGFRHPEKLESLKNEILEENVSCLSFCGDISNPSFVDEMIKQSLLTFSKIDCLVNNAGIDPAGRNGVADGDDRLQSRATRLLKVVGRRVRAQRAAENGLANEIEITAVLEHRTADDHAELLALQIESAHQTVERRSEHVLVGRLCEIGRASCRERVSSPV